MLKILLEVSGAIEESERTKIAKVIPNILQVVFNQEQTIPYTIVGLTHNAHSKQCLIVFTIINPDSPTIDLVRARAKLETLLSKSSLPPGFKASVELFQGPILFPHH